MRRCGVAVLLVIVSGFTGEAQAEESNSQGVSVIDRTLSSSDPEFWGELQDPVGLGEVEAPPIWDENSIYADAGMLVTRQFGQAYEGRNWYANYIISIAQVADQGYFLAERYWRMSGLSVIKTDRNGYPEWRRDVQYGTGHIDQVINGGTDSVKQAADGGFVVVGSMRPGASNPHESDPRDGFLIKYDANGNKVWEAAVGFEYTDSLVSVELAPGGGFVVAGSSSNGRDVDAFLAKIDENGRVIWKKRYDSLGGVAANGDAATDVEVDHGAAGFVLGGNTRCPGIGCGFLARTDLDGNLLQVSTTGLQRNQVNRVAPTPDGGYAIAAKGTLPSVGRWDAIVVKLDGAGHVQWTGRYSERGGSATDESAIGLDVSLDGIRVVGYTTPLEGVYIERPCFWHVDWTGRTVAQECMRETGIWYAVRAISDGSTVVGGPYVLPRSIFAVHDAYLLKFKEAELPGYIAGSLYEDENLSCTPDASEQKVGRQWVKALDQQSQSNVHFVAVNTNGDYSAAVPPGNYTVSLVNPDLSGEICGPQMSYSAAVVRGQTSGGNDFFVAQTCRGTLDLEGGRSDSGSYQCPVGREPQSPCAGFAWTYKALLINESRASWDTGAAVKFTFPWSLSATEVRHEASSSCAGWNLLSVTSTDTATEVLVVKQTGDLPPAQGECTIDVTVRVPSGSRPPWTTTAALDANCRGTRVVGVLDDNVIYNRDRCSCDPNDMQVSPQGCGSTGAITGQELAYTTRFQNVGFGPAHDVVIRDSLDEGLDPSTLRLVSSSHRITRMQVEPGNELVIRFDGIELPPQAWDPKGSNGSVTFAIKPREPYGDGTVIDNGAAIFFDDNPPIMTNKVVNTLYNGGPVPVADFRAVRRGEGFDFSYTGGSTGVSYQWNFGTSATPSVADTASPRGVVFSGRGPFPVSLTVGKDECSSATSQNVSACVGWSTTRFELPMGGKPKQIGSMLPMKFRLYHQSQLVSSATQLEAILASEHGWTPQQGCWPRARVLADGQEVPLAEEERCFRFGDEGKLMLNVALDSSRFRAGQSYEVEVENLACTLAPDNNAFQVKN
jgi:uncharacterized repeat protein (TIGR01451 family)